MRFMRILPGLILLGLALTLLFSEGPSIKSDRLSPSYRLFLYPPDTFAIHAENITGKDHSPEELSEISQMALKLDPSNAYRWADAGEALMQVGKTKEAHRYMIRAAKLAPNTPPILIRTANYFFTSEEPQNALPYLRTVLELVPDYDDFIFGYYSRMGISVDEALNRDIPHQKRTLQSYCRYLMRGESLKDTGLVWSNVQSSGFNDEALTMSYISYLIAHREYAQATEIWAKQLGEQRQDYLRPNRLSNARFERKPYPCPLDWTITPISGVEISQEGQLSVRFEGKENLDFTNISQMAYLPQGSYVFTAKVSYEEVTTNQGPFFEIVTNGAGGQPIAETQMMQGTGKDVVLQVPFQSRPQKELVTVRLRRRSSKKFDNKIQGLLKIQELSIRPKTGTTASLPK